MPKTKVKPTIVSVRRFLHKENQGGLEDLGFWEMELDTITLVQAHGIPGEISECVASYIEINGRRLVVRGGELTLPHGMKFPVDQFEHLSETTAKGALARIKWARDYHAEHGVYPSFTVGKDQCFDDWAADLAEKILKQ